jgi:hypothetical protein
MMPPLPPIDESLIPDASARQMLRDYAAIYGADCIEACAVKCEEVASKPSSLWEEHGCWSHAAENCVAAIRALPVED